MKSIFVILALFLSSYMLGQLHISGQVTDAKTKEPLAFANILYETQKGVVADFDGDFFLKVPQNTSEFYVTYVGYQRKKVSIVTGKRYYKVVLKPIAESLGTIVISNKYVNPAIALIKRVVKAKKHNDYRKKLSKYAYTKYFKFLVSTDIKSMTNLFDTIYKGDKLIRIDSSLYETKKMFADKDMFIIESVSKINGGSNKEKEKIIATRTAGLKNPLYELIAIQTAGRNVYDDNYKFLFSEYLGPLTSLSIKQYKYEIDDTIRFTNRKVIVVSYRNTKKPLISGQIYLDAQSLAIAKLTLNTFKAFELQTTHNFKYYPKFNVWFPEEANMHIKKAGDKKNIIFGGGTMTVGYSKSKDTVLGVTHSNPKSDLDYAYATSNTILSNVLLGKHYAEKINYDLQVAPMAHKKTEDFWQRFKSQKLLERDLRTYKFIDSTALADHFERDLARMKTIITGYYPLGKIDANFMNLFSYNRYEGFRLQIGGKTNRGFSNKYYLSAYAAYGFRDKDFKYQGKVKYKLNQNTQTYINASYFRDLQKSASFSELPYSPMASKMSHFTDDKYYMSKGFRFEVEHLITSKLQVILSYEQTTDVVKHDIPFHQGRIDFSHKDVAAFHADVVFTPKTKYMLTPEGRKTVSDAYPKFYLHFEKNMPQWQTDKSDYYRLDLQSFFKKKYLNKNFTTAIFRVGFASQGVGLNKMYMPNTNGVLDDNIFKRFSPATNASFETMSDLSFADNLVTSLHLRHTFAKLKWSKDKTFDISMVARVAWGVSFDENKYLGVETLEQGYYETGLEFRRLFSGLGLGVYYRLGDYAQPEVIDNLTIKMTINPFKLFGK